MVGINIEGVLAVNGGHVHLEEFQIMSVIFRWQKIKSQSFLTQIISFHEIDNIWWQRAGSWGAKTSPSR